MSAFYVLGFLLLLEGEAMQRNYRWWVERNLKLLLYAVVAAVVELVFDLKTTSNIFRNK